MCSLLSHAQDRDDLLERIEQMVVLRHAHGSHLVDGYLNACNLEDQSRVRLPVRVADLTLGGIRDELREAAEVLERRGLRPDHLCVVSSDNLRAVQSATVVLDYLSGKGELYDSWRAKEIPERQERLVSPLEKKERELLQQRVAARLATVPQEQDGAAPLLMDRRLRERWFGPRYEGGSHLAMKVEDEKRLVSISELSQGRFRLSFQQTTKTYPREGYGRRMVLEGTPLEEREIDFFLGGGAEDRAHHDRGQAGGSHEAIERVRKVKAFMDDGQACSLADAFGAESKGEVFERARAFLRSGLVEALAACLAHLDHQEKVHVLLSTHDSVGAQLISYLSNGHDQWSDTELYELKPAEAVFMPIDTLILSRISPYAPEHEFL